MSIQESKNQETLQDNDLKARLALYEKAIEDEPSEVKLLFLGGQDYISQHVRRYLAFHQVEDQFQIVDASCPNVDIPANITGIPAMCSLDQQNCLFAEEALVAIREMVEGFTGDCSNDADDLDVIDVRGEGVSCYQNDWEPATEEELLNSLLPIPEREVELKAMESRLQQMMRARGD